MEGGRGGSRWAAAAGGHGGVGWRVSINEGARKSR